MVLRGFLGSYLLSVLFVLTKRGGVCSVDVTDELLFLVTKMSPYYERQDYGEQDEEVE